MLTFLNSTYAIRHVLATFLALSGFGAAQATLGEFSETQAAMQAIRSEAIEAHMLFLSDGLLQGREPGTTGYDIAATYIATQMKASALTPAGVNGDWIQVVPFRKFKAVPGKTSLELLQNGRTKPLVFGQDYVTDGDPERKESVLDVPLVFAGYGLAAPEIKRDDYAGLDVRGKAVVVLYGAPPQLSPVQRAYFSDLINKERLAAENGAVGFMVIMTPEEEKQWPWQWLAPQIQAGGIKALEPDGTLHDSFPRIRGGVIMLNQRGAEKLFPTAPNSSAEVFASMESGNVPHFSLPVHLKMHAITEHTTIHSANVVGARLGSDPNLRQEYVVYSAHLDHVGICPPLNGDDVCHGAFDNASGAATLLEIAHAFMTLPRPPRRSILFAFVTGEEKGLLGSDYFARHPTVAADMIVANINIDGAPGFLYPLKDIFAVGAEDSSLAENVQVAAQRLKLEVSPDPMPEQVFFIRSDQYSFVRRGVPSILISQGWKSADPKVDSEHFFKTWTTTIYHTPKDNMSQNFDFVSGVEGAQLNFLVGYEVAQQANRPRWNKGDFFGTTFDRTGRQ